MHSGQRFRFKSIMWASVTTLLILVIIILGFDLHHIITFGLMWTDRNEFSYYLLLPGLVLVVTINFIIAIIITLIDYKHNELIELPNLLFFKKTIIVVFPVPFCYDRTLSDVSIEFPWLWYYTNSIS